MVYKIRCIYIYIYTIICVVSLVLLYILDLEYNAYITKFACYSSFFLVILYCLRKFLLKDGNWFDANIFFIIGYLLVFVQVPMKIVNGISVTEVKFGTNFMNYEYVTYGSILSLLGLASYLLGVELKWHPESNFMTMPASGNTIKKGISFFYYVSISLLFIFIIQTMGVHYGENIGFIAQLIYSLLNMFSIILFASSGFSAIHECNRTGKRSLYNYIMFQRKSVLIYFILLSAYFVNMGTRAAFLTFLMAFFTPYFCLLKKLKFNLFVLFLVVGMGLVAWSAAFRSSEDLSFSEKFQNSLLVIENIEALSEDFSGSVYLALTYELEKSYLSYNELLRMTDMTGLQYGTSWGIQAISSIIPLSGNLIKYFWDLQDEKLVSSLALSELVSRDFAGKGMGSSIIGDIYYNFGTIGVLVFMLILGYFVSYIRTGIHLEHKPLLKIMFLSIYSCMIFNNFLICRNEYYLGWTFYIRTIILFFILEYFFRRREENYE